MQKKNRSIKGDCLIIVDFNIDVTVDTFYKKKLSFSFFSHSQEINQNLRRGMCSKVFLKKAWLHKRHLYAIS